MSKAVTPGSGRPSDGGGTGERAAGTLDRGPAILTHVARHRGSSTAEIAQALGLTRSTAYRLVDRLREQGWLTQAPATTRWQLGPAAVRLASAAVASTRPRADRNGRLPFRDGTSGRTHGARVAPQHGYRPAGCAQPAAAARPAAVSTAGPTTVLDCGAFLHTIRR